MLIGLWVGDFRSFGRARGGGGEMCTIGGVLTGTVGKLTHSQW